MRLLALAIALLIAVPSADAAVIATTKQKKLPVISNAHMNGDLRGFRFDVTKAPTTFAYDVWARIEDKRADTVAEWFVKSMKLRHRAKKVKTAAFEADVRSILAFEDPGTFVLTLFVCPANLREPNRTACASSSTTFQYGTKKAR